MLDTLIFKCLPRRRKPSDSIRYNLAETLAISASTITPHLNVSYYDHGLTMEYSLAQNKFFPPKTPVFLNKCHQLSDEILSSRRQSLPTVPPCLCGDLVDEILNESMASAALEPLGAMTLIVLSPGSNYKRKKFMTPPPPNYKGDANENDITSFFECPVCFDYVLPPIYQCRSGHLVCSSCRVNLKCCPTCRGPLGNIRNLAMEKVASTILFPCKFNNSGCTKSLSHTEKLEHEEICEYRPYVCPCPGASCKWQGSLEQVMSHLLVSHKTITTLQGEDIVFLATDITLPGNVDWVMMQSCFGHYFILVLEKQERNVATIMPQSAASAGSGGGGGSSSNQNSSLTGNITGSSHLAHLGNEGTMSGGHAATGNMLNPVGSNLSGMNASALGIHSGSLSTSSATAPLQQFYAVVQIIGSRKQAENFAYKLELNGNNRRLTWEARPRSVHEGVSSAISKCDCLVFESGVAALFSENGNLAINVTITLTSSSSSSSINNNNKSSSPTNALSFSNNNNNSSGGLNNNNNITGAPGTGGSSSGYLGGGGGCCGGAHNHPSNTGSGGGGNGFINHSSETSFSPPTNISSSPSICPPNYHPPQQQQLNCHYLDDKSSTSAAAKGSSLVVPGVSEPDQNAFTPPPLLNSNSSSTYLPQQQQQHYFYQTINNNNNTHNNNNNNSNDIACGNNDTCNGTSYHHHHYPFNHLLASPSTNNNCGGGVGNLFTSFSSNNHLHHFVGGHSGHHLASASAGNAIP